MRRDHVTQNLLGGYERQWGLGPEIPINFRFVFFCPEMTDSMTAGAFLLSHNGAAGIAIYGRNSFAF